MSPEQGWPRVEARWPEGWPGALRGGVDEAAGPRQGRAQAGRPVTLRAEPANEDEWLASAALGHRPATFSSATWSAARRWLAGLLLGKADAAQPQPRTARDDTRPGRPGRAPRGWRHIWGGRGRFSCVAARAGSATGLAPRAPRPAPVGASGLAGPGIGCRPP